MPSTLFFRLLDAEDKGTALKEAVATLQEKPISEAFAVNPESFEQVPGSPFTYQSSNQIRQLFSCFSAFKFGDRDVAVGVATGNDFRFVRAWWEINPKEYRTYSLNPDFSSSSSMHQERWITFIKGGVYSPFYLECYTVIDWHREGIPIEESFIGARLKKPFFFKPGLTWPLRGAIFSAQAVPKGCIFSVAGKMAFAQETYLPKYLGIFNSKITTRLLRAQSAAVRIQFEAGLIQNLPTIQTESVTSEHLGIRSSNAWSFKRSLSMTLQTSHAFILPALLQVQGATLSQRAQAWADTVATTEQQLSRHRRPGV